MELAWDLFPHIPVLKSQGKPRLKTWGLDPPLRNTGVGVKNLGHFCHPSTAVAIKNVFGDFPHGPVVRDIDSIPG